VYVRFSLFGSTGANTAWQGTPSAHRDELVAFEHEWIQACALPQNRALVPLKGKEGGLCSPDEIKPARFVKNGVGFVTSFDHGDWTLREIYDLKEAFIKVMERLLGMDVYDAAVDAAHCAYNTGEVKFLALPLNPGLKLIGFQNTRMGNELHGRLVEAQNRRPAGACRACSRRNCHCVNSRAAY